MWAVGGRKTLCCSRSLLDAACGMSQGALAVRQAPRRYCQIATFRSQTSLRKKNLYPARSQSLLVQFLQHSRTSYRQDTGVNLSAASAMNVGYYDDKDQKSRQQRSFFHPRADEFRIHWKDQVEDGTYHTFHQRRYFSNKPGDELEKPPTKATEEKVAKKMEPDFARYLSGDMKPPVNEPSQGKSRRQRSRLLAQDRDKEVYTQIRHLQRMQKEQSRLKTATNIHRALWGNVIICTAKFGAWLSSGSSGMLAEFIHSVVDCGNQALLLVGLRDSHMVADRKHPYGYGKSIYFWALVSALGTFFLGAGVSMTNAVGDLMHPSLHAITWEVWGVLIFSFAVDGYVFQKTISEIYETKPKGVSFWKHLQEIRDPATLAVLLEDGAACLGVVLATGGIAASQYTGNPIFDGLAGIGISTLLGLMGLALVRVNHRFLLGQAVDPEITDDIKKILLSRRSIDNIGSVQSQWTGPETFSYKAEVDFDGTYLAAKLMPIYQQEFLQIRDSMDEELQVLLALYAEDVMRTVEREVRHVEAHIRKKYPGAEFIELEPMSVDVDRLAIDDNLEAELRRVESDALNRYLKSLRKEQTEQSYSAIEMPKSDPTAPSTDKPKKQR